MKSSSRIFNKYLLSITVFFIYFLLSFQGFDVTDRGFHFTNQYQLFQYPLSSIHINPIYILSDVAGGLWLHLLGTPNVFWGALGGAVLFSLCAFIVASILANYFPNQEVFFYALICIIFATAYYTLQIIDYFTFPALLILIFFWIFNKLLSVSGNSREFAAYAFILGFLSIPIVLSRFTLITMILIPPLLALYYWWTERPFEGIARGARYAFAGVIVSTGVAISILYLLDILGIYVDLTHNQLLGSATGREVYTTGHSMSTLFRTYLSDYVLTLVGVFIFIGGIFAIERLQQKISLRWLALALVAATASCLTLSLIPQIPVITFIRVTYALPRLVVGIVIFFMVVFLYYHERSDKNLALLLIISGAVMIVNPLGSDDGILKSTYAFWLILPLSLLCINRLGRQTKNTFLQTISALIPTILVMLLIIGVFFHGVNVYRDVPNRLDMTTPFQSSQLSGTYSTAERVQVTDELICVIERETEPGDYVLMVNDIPMFYYLTGTRPALGQPWLFLYPEESIIDLEEERAKTNKIMPKLFVYSKVNTEDRYWPLDSTPHSEQDENKLSYLKDRYIHTYRYSLLWENDAFSVYWPPLNDSVK
jgi:hypothetical protein